MRLEEIEDLKARTKTTHLSVKAREDRKAAEKLAPIRQRMDDYFYAKELNDINNEIKHLEI